MSHTDKFNCKKCGIKVTIKHDVFRAEMFDNLCSDCYLERGGIYYDNDSRLGRDNKRQKSIRVR
jgi:hypothetical protein